MNEVAFAHKLSKHSGAIERLIVRLLEQGVSLEQIKTSLETHDQAFSQAGNKFSELENAIIALSERGKLAQNEAKEALKGTELRSRHHANELSEELLSAVSAKIEAQNEARIGVENRVLTLSEENLRAHRLIAGISEDVSGVKALAQDGFRIAKEIAARPVVELSANAGTTALVDSFQGNWKKDKAYVRGDTFTFRGGFFLVLKDCKGLLPDVKSQTGPNRFYACLAAPGAPGQNTQSGSSGGGSGSVTSITAGTGLTGGTITSTGTIAVDGTVVALRSALATVAFSGAYADLSGKPTIPTQSVGANPSAPIGLTAVNGSATTFLRSDGAPALSQAIVPTWTGLHSFTNSITSNRLGLGAASNGSAMDSNAIAYTTRTGTGGGTGQINLASHTLYNGAPASTEIMVAGLYDSMDTGSTTSAGSHVVGIIGRSQNNTSGATPINGVEGRIIITSTGTGADTGAGVWGIADYNGTTFTGRTLTVFKGYAEVYNGTTSTPVTNGTTVVYRAYAPTGGDPTKAYALVGDSGLQIVTGGAIASASSGGTKNINISHNGTDGYASVVGGGNLVLDANGAYVVINTGTLGVAPLTNGASLGINGFAWNALVTALVSNAGKIGYTTGTGATVTQLTSRTTGVTINALSGQITGNGTSLSASVSATFTVTNSKVAATDSIILNLKSGGSPSTVYMVSNITNGAFSITVRNVNPSGADTTTPVMQFTIIQGSNS